MFSSWFQIFKLSGLTFIGSQVRCLWFDSLSRDLYDFFSVLIQVLLTIKKIVSKKTEFLKGTHMSIGYPRGNIS